MEGTLSKASNFYEAAQVTTFLGNYVYVLRVQLTSVNLFVVYFFFVKAHFRFRPTNLSTKSMFIVHLHNFLCY